jgi:hypothetical protein
MTARDAAAWIEWIVTAAALIIGVALLVTVARGEPLPEPDSADVVSIRVEAPGSGAPGVEAPGMDSPGVGSCGWVKRSAEIGAQAGVR